MPPAKKARSAPVVYASWKDEDRDRILLHSYLRVVSEGRFSNGERGLKPGGWEEVAESFNEQNQLGYTADQLRNRFNALRKQYAQYDEFIRQAGSGMAANWPFLEPHQWEELLRVKPYMEWIRDNGEKLGFF